MIIKRPAFLRDYRIFQIFILGIISGMPFAVLYTSLIAWLKDHSIELSIITTFAIARLPYSLKIFWSPIVDHIALPFLSRFGRRKSWMILSVCSTACILFLISGINPDTSLTSLRYLAILLGIMAATYDISYDALRIEMLSDEEQGVGAATAVLGYRVGAFITGAGALYIADVTANWSLTFIIVSALFIVGLFIILTVKEISIASIIANTSLRQKIYELVIAPFRDFLSRDKAIIVCLAIVLYKMGEAMLGFVSVPFYMELGYSKAQIGVLVKGFGVIATMLGAYAGGMVVYKLGNIKGMIICGILQAIANLMYMWLHYQDVSNSSLMVTIAIDNFTGGMGSTALVAYLSMLCNRRYTATQYALLSSLSTIMNSTISSQSGSLIKMIGWDDFFITTVLLEIPSLLLLLYLGKMRNNTTVSTKTS